MSDNMSRHKLMSSEELYREMHCPSVPIEQHISDLRSRSGRVKAQAFALVGHAARARKDHKARQALMDALEHGTDAMRRMACMWIDVNDEEAIGVAIKHALDKGELGDVRVSCTYILSLMLDERSARALLQLLGDESPGVRAEAANGLGWFSGDWDGIGCESITAALKSALSDPVWHVRWAAASSLFQLDGCAALPAVEQMADDPSVPDDWRDAVLDDLARYRQECGR